MTSSSNQGFDHSEQLDDDDDCIRDDSTECDCSACTAAEDRFWREQEGYGRGCIDPAHCCNPHDHNSSECEFPAEDGEDRP